MFYSDAKRSYQAQQVVSDSVATNEVEQERLKGYYKSLGKWDFIKHIRDAEPSYVDLWEASDRMDNNSPFTRAIAKALGKTPDQVISESKAHDHTVVSEPTLEENKSIAKSLVNAERERRKFADVTHGGNLFTVSEWDIMMIMSLLTASKLGQALPTDNYWRTATNVNVNLSNGDLESLDNLIKNQIQSAYTWSWSKKAQIDACTTQAELDAVDLELTHL